LNEFSALMKIAHPELYRANAFRLARLAVDAGPRDIARQLERLKIMERLGTGAHSLTGPLALDLPVGGDALRMAVERLRDPESRALEEFFWFWPMACGESASDPALAALTRGEALEARTLWWEYLQAPGAQKSVACHNLAVLAHVRTLDLELAAANGQPLTEAQTATRDACWMEAYGHWRELVADDAFWDNLAERYRSLNEPEVGEETAQRLRSALPAALVSVNARLAVRAAEEGRIEEARRQLALAAGSGFELEDVEGAFRAAAETHWERIKLLKQSAETEAETAPERADAAGRQFAAAAGAALLVLDRALPAKHRLRAAAHDEVALTLLECQIAYANRTQDWITSVALLEEALPVARSASARGRLQENLVIVRQNARALLCWFCETNSFDGNAAVSVPMYGHVTHLDGKGGSQTHCQQCTVHVPRCGRCLSAHRWREGFTLLGGLAGGVIGFGGYEAVVYATDAWFLALLLLSACMVVGANLGSWWGQRRFARGIKNIGEKTRFPPIEHLKMQGWVLGTKQAGT
jgi:hypothetical protein